MSEEILILEQADGKERLLIVRRLDGAFTYRRQWRNLQALCSEEASDNAWGPAGPDCGIYDSAETAETEARQRVPWLKDLI
jgi:hypothetical protein